MKRKSYVMVAMISLLLFSCKEETTGDAFPTDGLVSYFNFNDNLKDERNNTPDGINTGGAAFVTGKSGKAISFNGVDQKVTFARKQFRSSNAISVAFWVKSAHKLGLQFFMGSSDFLAGNTDNYSMVISVPTTKSAAGSYISDTWTHFAGTYNGTDIKIYINGILAETENHPGTIESSDEDLFIGSRGGPIFWSGSVDELFIYGKALTQAEVTQLYNLHQ
jgi:hypothetical protein